MDLTTVVLLVASAIPLIRFRLNSTWRIVLGAVAGIIESPAVH